MEEFEFVLVHKALDGVAAKWHTLPHELRLELLELALKCAEHPIPQEEAEEQEEEVEQEAAGEAEQWNFAAFPAVTRVVEAHETHLVIEAKKYGKGRLPHFTFIVSRAMLQAVSKNREALWYTRLGDALLEYRGDVPQGLLQDTGLGQGWVRKHRKRSDQKRQKTAV